MKRVMQNGGQWLHQVEISILQWLIKREIQGWDTFSGTSMAAPHVTGAMGVLMSRYPSMNAIQVRDVMFTTN